MTPSTIEKLDPLAAPLQGINLIEASAGTGKTYTITTLFVRLILEQKLSVNQILVVTFTDVATEELRDRIRRRLREALTAFEQGESQDDILAGLIHQYADHQDAIFQLTNALRGFDEAAIFTIHSFCRQMLQDNAFESGVLFDTELVSDQSQLLREIVEDFWRQHFYNASPLFITYALENGYQKPNDLLKILNDGQYVGQPFLKIIPEVEIPQTETQELAFHTAFTQCQLSWQSQGAEVEQLLLDDDQLNGKKYIKKKIPQWCQTLHHFFNAPMMSLRLPEKFEHFTTQKLVDSVKKGKTPPTHPFFKDCDHLLNCQQTLATHYDQYLLALKRQLFDFAEHHLAQKKQQHHIQSFDDLLINLYKALKGTHGDRLAQLIRSKYHAALIDEFQDTDPVQYDIFRRIYGESDQTLFLIGDPKQAIYSFRGADIFTYMAACRDAKHRYTLVTNWRSEAHLIDAVNVLFDKVQYPFLFEDIPFQPVHAPSQRLLEGPRLKIENKYLPPLQIWFVPRQLADFSPEKLITKAWAQQQIPESISHEIARLLMLGQQEQALIGQRPLRAGDIAILVRKNKQAVQIQKVLTRLQIPSVLYSRESLFASHEVMEMERLLLAIADPSHEPTIKAALTTDMIGLSGTELHDLMENEPVWQKRLFRFQQYHFTWKNVGFIQMFRQLLLKEQIQTRLLIYPDGERRLTNVFHAAEMLQQVTVQQKLGIVGLCQWLSQQRYREGKVPEEQQLRLESDENRVKIVTIHKSKGLEYPIVFCPFLWDGQRQNKKKEPSQNKKEEQPKDKKIDQLTFHNEQGELVLDLGSHDQEQYKIKALEEERAENLRLFYVAVTRAKHRCYLIWGAFKDAATSPLAHLLYPNMDINQADDTQLENTLKQLAAESNHQLQVSYLPTDRTPYQRALEPIKPLKPRRFIGQINKSWKVSSFTSLSHPTPSLDAADRPDYDEMATTRFGRDTVIVPDKNHIFNFHRGARAGNFLHALFENLDFTQPDPTLIQNQLTQFGYEVEQWQTVITTLVDNVLTTPLEPQQPQLTLSRITREKRLNEVEFYYPLAPITFKALQAIFTEFDQPIHAIVDEQQNARLTFSPVQGFMKGFIDMIFEYAGRYYLVDYKSNLLGTQQQAYHHSRLKEVMIREAYLLQYHIYAIALHRYLSTRLPHYDYDKHFGGIYYLFLRGMQPRWGAHYGIYRDLPATALIKCLSSYFGE